MSANTPVIEYASGALRNAWLRHPIYGDPSFDAFVRLPGNPVHRGSPPLEWPVNGFLFHDPVSGNWYIYVGAYPRGYHSPDTMSTCLAYRSTDDCRTWQYLGKVLEEGPQFFDHNGLHTGSMPDVNVLYADGRYHMSYDWGRRPAGPDEAPDGGIAYAWAERPEGPFHRHTEPIHRSALQATSPWFGRYHRLYAQSLVHRENDWLMLAMTDNMPGQSWALTALTADTPTSAWHGPTFLIHVESDIYLPPLMEFFPAFTHDGYVYTPFTSVALNRTFQMLARAPIEQAHRPEAWEVVQHGSLWHAEPVENEYFGIWGQTFSGSVSDEGVLRAMFCCRDTLGMGTVNLAQRPFGQPHRDRGFAFHGLTGPSLTCITRAYDAFSLTMEATLKGLGTEPKVTLFWGYRGPLGPDRTHSDATLHPLMRTSYRGVELTASGWCVVEVDAAGQRSELASGAHAGANENSRLTLQIEVAADGSAALQLGGTPVWEGAFTTPQPLEPLVSSAPGAIGLLAEPHSYLNVERFEVTGDPQSVTLDYLYTDALLGAGENAADWSEVEAPAFRHGLGAVHKGDGGRAKWNVLASGITLWAPSDPGYGAFEVLLDGAPVAQISLYSEDPEPSKPRFRCDGLIPGHHAVVLRALEGPLVVDALEARYAAH